MLGNINHSILLSSKSGSKINFWVCAYKNSLERHENDSVSLILRQNL